jgi:hypothetical protein
MRMLRFKKVYERDVRLLESVVVEALPRSESVQFSTPRISKVFTELLIQRSSNFEKRTLMSEVKLLICHQ